MINRQDFSFPPSPNSNYAFDVGTGSGESIAKLGFVPLDSSSRTSGKLHREYDMATITPDEAVKDFVCYVEREVKEDRYRRVLLAKTRAAVPEWQWELFYGGDACLEP